jgi:hypothetical protein
MRASRREADASKLASEELRLSDLFVAAQAVHLEIIEELSSQLARASSAVVFGQRPRSWLFGLGEATLELTRPTKNPSLSPMLLDVHPVNVVAYAEIIATSRGESQGYSLWYSDQGSPRRYGWHRITFRGLMELTNMNPIPLPPDGRAEMALNGLAMEYRAESMATHVQLDINDFVGRLAKLLIDAARI